ncbi:hypothetical protein [Ramlibacter cellulosilyticus]|nr:hypothetical protein [Ramlibacter cellulosilyticus]
MLTAAALAVSATVSAKLPAPVLDEAAKAKAAEAAARTAWQGKVDAYQLCKAQDRVAARYKANHPAQAKPAAAAPAATPVAAAPAGAASAAAAAAKPPVPTAATASQGGGTPVAAVVAAAPAIPPCADPGPFAYAPPEQKPLETSGAHSPAATAASPPSVRTPSAEMAPAKPSTGPAPAKK